eukprot:15212868-Ditylum_brightwellii.AAC.1
MFLGWQDVLYHRYVDAGLSNKLDDKISALFPHPWFRDNNSSLLHLIKKKCEVREFGTDAVLTSISKCTLWAVQYRFNLKFLLYCTSDVQQKQRMLITS